LRQDLVWYGRGWLLLIKDEAGSGRVLVALVVSFMFLALRLSLKPLER
jgi:hypothetical protein